MSLLRGPIGGAIDRVMDFSVVPGFSKIGYEVRSRIDGWEDVDLTGRSIMVTGSNSGLGQAAALEIARLGGRLHMVCRNPEKGEEARAAIATETGTEPELHICDLSDLNSVRSFAGSFIASGEPLDVLINNAGVMPPEREHTDAGFELTFATNVLGPFLLTEMLMPLLEASPDGRAVMMSSGGMYSSGFNLRDPELEGKDYKPTAFYAQTKRAEVMLTDEWQDRAGPDGPKFFSMHPGWSVTPGMSAALPGFHKYLGPILRDSAEGADTAVWLCAAGPEVAPAGEFFQDRRPRPKHRIPSTRESAEDRRKLFELCSRLTGYTPD